MHRTYTAEEMRRYWRVHSKLWVGLDREADPEGLTNVCYSGAPLWLNRFASACQHRVVGKLLERMGGVAGLSVLDIGCGVGRWSGLMSALGGDVTGIDLQAETLVDNRRRFPACRFLEMTADSLALRAESFDVAVSVTVIQHMPDDAQEAALSEIRRVLRAGGCLVLLEGTRDRGSDVFARPIRGWIDLARRFGLEADTVLPYDYSPLIYGLRRLAGVVRERGGSGGDPSMPVEQYIARYRGGSTARDPARKAYEAALHAATLASYPLERLLAAIGPASASHHVGILFRRNRAA